MKSDSSEGQNKPTQKKSESGLNPYVKYSGIALQMMITIAGATWGGMLLDEHFKVDPPIWTIVCSLTGVGVALYMIIRSVNKTANDDN